MSVFAALVLQPSHPFPDSDPEKQMIRHAAQTEKQKTREGHQQM
jgi:hypothetical protein